MYNWITLLYIHLKLRQHCSSAVLQHKMLKRSIVRRNFKLSPCSWHGNSPGISQWGCRTEVSNLGPAGQTRPGPPIYKCGQAHPFTNAARPTHLQTRPGPPIYKQTRPGPPIYKRGHAHPFTNTARPTHLQTRPCPPIYKHGQAHPFTWRLWLLSWDKSGAE